MECSGNCAGTEALQYFAFLFMPPYSGAAQGENALAVVKDEGAVTAQGHSFNIW